VKRTLLLGLSIALLIILSSTFAKAIPVISVGTHIQIDATTFALPIEITDAVELISWQFDLAYDPNDVQINTACDPFSDPFCSLITGPVTEGDFFSSGAPFNLLVPGFIDLDPNTLAQTGLLFGVHGEYGGFPPAPSGDGVLAYVEFTLLGNGESPITVENPSVTSSVIPEPATLILLTSGLGLFGMRRLARRGRRE
jgi:hypothetical protein